MQQDNQFFILDNLYRIVGTDKAEYTMIYCGKPHNEHLFKFWENGKAVGRASALSERHISSIHPHTTSK